MAGEPTNKPTGPGSNPKPPVNDTGAAMPNPAPPVPPSVPAPPPQPLTGVDKIAEDLKNMGKSTAEAQKALKEFREKQEQLNQFLAKSGETLKKVQEADQAEADAIVNKRKVEADTLQEFKKTIAVRYAEFRNIDGSWKEGTEVIQRLYRAEVRDLTNERREARKAAKEAKDRSRQHSEMLAKENEERENAIRTLGMMEDIREDIIELDASFKEELDPAFTQLKKSVVDAASQISIYERRKGPSEGLEKGLRAVNEKIERAELESGAKKQKAEFEVDRKKSIKEKDEAILAPLQQRGLEGAVEIRKQLEPLVTQMTEDLRKIDPNITDDELEKRILQMLKDQATKDKVAKDIREKYERERREAEDKVIKSTMEEKKVSREVAVLIARDLAQSKSSELYKTLKEISEKESGTLASLNKIEETTMRSLVREEEDAAQRLQDKAESAKNDPNAAAREMGNRVAAGIDRLKRSMGEWFKKDDGFWKTTLLFVVVAIGATLGYIWAKIQLMIKILTMLPFGIGQYMQGIFSGIGAGATGLLSIIGAPFTRLFAFLQPIISVMPKLSGFLNQVFSAFRFGFTILGPLFMWIGIAINVIRGVIRGMSEIGGIKGIIAGIIAGIVSFFTFGLIDIKTTIGIFKGIFKVLAALFSPIINLVKNLYNLFMWIIEPLWTAMKNIVKIFSGGGNILTNIFKAIIEWFKGILMYQLRLLIGVFIKLPWYILKYLVEGLILIPKMIIGALWYLQMTLIKWIIKFNIFLLTLPFKIAKFIFDFLVSIPSLIMDGIKAMLDILFEAFVGLPMWIWGEITGIFKGIWNAIIDALGSIPFIGGAIKSFLGGGSAGAEGDAATVEKGVVEKAEGMMGSLVDSAKEKITNFAGSIWDGAKGLFGSIWSGVSGVLGKLGSGVGDFFGNVWGGITSFFGFGKKKEGEGAQMGAQRQINAGRVKAGAEGDSDLLQRGVPSGQGGAGLEDSPEKTPEGKEKKQEGDKPKEGGSLLDRAMDTGKSILGGIGDFLMGGPMGLLMRGLMYIFNEIKIVIMRAIDAIEQLVSGNKKSTETIAKQSEKNLAQGVSAGAEGDESLLGMGVPSGQGGAGLDDSPQKEWEDIKGRKGNKSPESGLLDRLADAAKNALLSLTKSGEQGTAISAPTTNVIGGGGGGESVIMPPVSRNNDPTFRALLFLEQPSL